MWLIFAITLVIFVGVSADDDDCKKPIHRTCNSDRLPNFFPGTRDELDNYCSGFTEYLECGIRIERKCKRNGSSLEMATSILEVVNDVCDKNSLLYAVLADNIQCAKEFFQGPVGEECTANPLDEESFDKYAKALVEHGLIDSGDESDKRRCIQHTQIIACAALKLEDKCGESAMNAFVELIRKVAILIDENCSEEISEFLPVLIRLNKLEEEIEEEIENSLKKK